MKLHRCLTRPHARLGWILLAIGAFTCQLFGRHADWSSLLFLRKQLAQTTGIVRDTNRTGFTFGDETDGKPIYSVHFEFADATGQPWTGSSWTERRPPKRGQQVAVEYVSTQPQINRIVNFRSGPLPLWVGAAFLFPIFGVICILKALLGRDDPVVSGEEG